MLARRRRRVSIFYEYLRQDKAGRKVIVVCCMLFFFSSFFLLSGLPIVLEIFCGFYVISRLTYWFQWPMIRVVLDPESWLLAPAASLFFRQRQHVPLVVALICPSNRNQSAWIFCPGSTEFAMVAPGC